MKCIICSRTYIAFPFHKPNNRKIRQLVVFQLLLLADSSIQWSKKTAGGGEEKKKSESNSLPAMVCQEKENV